MVFHCNQTDFFYQLNANIFCYMSINCCLLCSERIYATILKIIIIILLRLIPHKPVTLDEEHNFSRQLKCPTLYTRTINFQIPMPDMIWYDSHEEKVVTDLKKKKSILQYWRIFLDIFSSSKVQPPVGLYKEFKVCTQPIQAKG